MRPPVSFRRLDMVTVSLPSWSLLYGNDLLTTHLSLKNVFPLLALSLRSCPSFTGLIDGTEEISHKSNGCSACDPEKDAGYEYFFALPMDPGNVGHGKRDRSPGTAIIPITEQINPTPSTSGRLVRRAIALERVVVGGLRRVKAPGQEPLLVPSSHSRY